MSDHDLPNPRAASPLDVINLKRKLRAARAKLGVSQRRAAELAGISKSVLEKYESRGNDRIPNTRQLHRLAHLYGASVDDLLGLDPTTRRTTERGPRASETRA